MSWVKSIEELEGMGYDSAMKELRSTFKSARINHGMPGSDHQLSILKNCASSAAYFECTNPGFLKNNKGITNEEAKKIIEEKTKEILNKWNAEEDAIKKEKDDAIEKRLQEGVKVGLSNPQTSNTVILENDQWLDEDDFIKEFAEEIKKDKLIEVFNFDNMFWGDKQEEILEIILTADTILFSTVFAYGYGQLESMLNLLEVMMKHERRIRMFGGNYELEKHLKRYIERIGCYEKYSENKRKQALERLNKVLDFHEIIQVGSWSMSYFKKYEVGSDDEDEMSRFKRMQNISL